jgi:hypothetical protein
MESFREKNGGLGSNRLIQEQIETEVSRNDTYTEAAAIGSEENLKARICDLQPHINQEEKEILTVKETTRRSNRRRKVRVYLP